MSNLDRRMMVAVRHHRAHDFEAAVAVCTEVLARQPSNPDANHLLGVIHSQRGDQDAAMRSVVRALRARPGNPHFHNTLGNALHRNGRNTEALASFREALRIDPNYAEAWSNLGLALQATGPVEPALTAFRRALALSPRYALAHNNLGNALVASGDLQGAMTSFDTAIECDPRYHEAYSNRGNTLKLLGRDAEALASYDAAIDIDRDDLAAVNNRAILQLQRGAHAGALPALEATVQRHPHDVATVTHLGVALAGLGRFDEALLRFDDVIAQADTYAPAHYYRGHVLRATGHQDEAIEHYLRAIARDANYADAFDGLAFTLLDTERFDDLDYIVEGILTEGRLPIAHGTGLRVIRAIGAWLRDHSVDCQRDIDAATAQALHASQASECERYPNDAMIGIYRQYLSLLLVNREQRPEHYAADVADSLHVVGESHCLAAAWTRVEVAGTLRRVVPHLVMGAKAWHFASPLPNDHKQSLLRVVSRLPEGATALFVFGEIDTRLDDGILRYVSRHADADLESVALKTVAGYVDYVAALARSRGIVPIFQGIPASAIDYANVDAVRRKRHLYLIRFVNAALATLAQQQGCLFLDVFRLSVGPDGCADGRAHLDAYHLVPSYLATALDGAPWARSALVC